MEFVIPKRQFLRGLTRTCGVADRKSSLPILSNILLSAETNLLRMSGTDLYLGVLADLVCDVKTTGTLAVSAKTLFDIVKNLPEGDVRFSVGPTHNAEIACGKVRFRIPGMRGDDFPPLPNPGAVEFHALSADVLSDLIAKTAYSMSTDDTRPHLAGALFEADGKKIRMVTTDGHRLSKCEHDAPATGGKAFSLTMLVPGKGIAELRRLIDDVRADAKTSEAKDGKEKTEKPEARIGIAVVGGNAFFRADGVTLSVKLADEQFPPYAKVIPQNHSKRVIIGRGLFIEALRRISLVSNDKSGGVRLIVQAGSLRVASENPDVGEGNEELDVDYAGEALTVGFNAKYLLDCLSALTDDEIALELQGDLDPGVVRAAQDANKFVGVVMPMKL